MIASAAYIVLHVLLTLNQDDFVGSDSNSPAVEESFRAETSGTNVDSAPAVSDPFMIELGNKLWAADTNRAASVPLRLQVKLQSRTRGDATAETLIAEIPRSVQDSPTYTSFIKLLDNFNRDVRMKEEDTEEERREVESFMDLLVASAPMKELFKALVLKKVISNTESAFRALLMRLWFVHYPRGRGPAGSSGFEHVFVGETNHGSVVGLHNWLQFYRLEGTKEVNYHGYFYSIPLGQGASLLKFRFELSGAEKPVTSMFIGTSPEYEMAQYTACVMLSQDDKCMIRINGKNVNIRTHKFTSRGSFYVGTAFPELARN